MDDMDGVDGVDDMDDMDDMDGVDGECERARDAFTMPSARWCGGSAFLRGFFLSARRALWAKGTLGSALLRGRRERPQSDSYIALFFRELWWTRALSSAP